MPPKNIVKPGPGQESVWDYPRPAICEPTPRNIRIVFNGETIVDTTDAWRVLETSHPPVYYCPPGDVQVGLLEGSVKRSFCEWKGRAAYWTLKVGDRIARNVAWSYPDPTPLFRPIRDFFAFYAEPMDACFVDGEKVIPQPGDFYGGWRTSDVVGPFKGDPGTQFW